MNMLIKNKKSKIIERVIAGLTHDGKVKVLLLALVIGFTACGDWLDVIPEGIPTVEMAFNSRSQSLKYLATCYSYMGNLESGNINTDPTILGDEVWTDLTYISNFWYSPAGIYLAQGRLSANNTIFGNWTHLYQGLRDCNVFLENIGLVPDLPDWERKQWIAEVKTLKAYYHFLLVRQYGPIPLIRENLPISVDVSTVKVVREPVDDCFAYIVQLIDEAIEGDMLPMQVLDVAGELGRITKPIALTLKAKALVYAASPLFNGNNEQATLKNKDGTPLFSATSEPDKWEMAVAACKEAITACHEADIKLYEFQNTGFNKLTDTITTQMSLRNAFTLRWNSDIIWANTKSIIVGNNKQAATALQVATAFLDDNYGYTSPPTAPFFGVPLKSLELFYTDKGVPLAEDKTRYINELYNLRTAQENEKLYVKEGETTVDFNFDREPRFYAWIGFDRGIWYGQGRNDDKEDLWYVRCRAGELDDHKQGTGNYPKKWVPYTNIMMSNTSYSSTSYPFPIMRLSDLYLLYAEAINEAEGPTGLNSGEMFEYIDRVRERAGLEGVKESWSQWARNSNAYEDKTRMRQIIQQERMIELMLEGHRFWDVRRWKTAYNWYSTPIDGWSVLETPPGLYYLRKELYNQKFGIRDYFWPIGSGDLNNNPNLVQNIGW